MSEFLDLISPKDALDLLLKLDNRKLGPVEIYSRNSLGRVTYIDIRASSALPAFAKTTVDGYAVIARDTYGAGEALPAYLKIVGEVPMGVEPEFSLASGDCGLIHTGGMLPDNADAVVMVEKTQLLNPNEVEILRSVATGENVIEIGEDIFVGQIVIQEGVRIRPAEIGGLMALGITRIQVARKPKVGIISTGDELVAPESGINPGQVRDINSYTLSALVNETGGEAVHYGLIPDQKEELFSAVIKAHSDCDLVVVTAGSSASARDLTASVFNEVGNPGVLVHGINIRPGKPTILGFCDGKVCIGLPGNPVSALVVASIFVTRIIEKLSGIKKTGFTSTLQARITINIPSRAGREDWVPVKIFDDHANGDDILSVEPIFGKSNLIFTLSRADGLIKIPADATGLNSGDLVAVHLFH
jgi:molybdopterin molybdotransferase